MSMSAAMSTAVSGLKTQQSSLDVISNNISNVNTTGYKSQRVSFSDLLSQTISSGSGSTATKGGTNPLQYGMGTSIGSVDTNMTQGTNSSTGISTDVAISGNGFLVVQGGSQGEYQYTRAGNLSIDNSGNVTVGGNQVCGWQKYTIDAEGNYVYDTNSKTEPLNVDTDSYNGNKKVMAAKASTESTFSGILDSSKTTAATNATALNVIGGTTGLTYDKSSSTQVYDAEGNVSNITIDMKKCYVDSATNTTSWYWQASSTDATLGTPSSGYIEFDGDGKIISNATGVTNQSAALDTAVTNVAGYADSNIKVSTGGMTTGDYKITVATAATGTGYDITLTDASGGTTTVFNSADGSGTFSPATGGTVTLTAPTKLAVGDTGFKVSSDTTNFSTTPTLSVKSNVGGTAAVDIKLDFSGLSTSANTTGSISSTKDGYASGERTSYSFSADGTIKGVYSNGETQSIGKLALAVFNNAAGLEKIGDNLYAASNNSGAANVVAANSGGSGTFTASSLESSNVDLAQEFSNMMIAQRAYQANSKVITTADDMLQALMSMK